MMEPIVLNTHLLLAEILFEILFVFFVGIPVLLLAFYTVGIQYQRESWWKWVRCVCAVFAAVGLVVDVIANFTVLSVVCGELPVVRQRGDSSVRREWTFSTRLERLVLGEPSWRTEVYIQVSLLLNFIAPREHPHILNVLVVRPL